MLIEERHQKIVDIINKKHSIKARDIAEMFDIGFDTARRDLRILEEKGFLKRTHGGAMRITPAGFTIPNGLTPRDIKRIKPNYLAIAIKAVELIEEHNVIYITGGSVGYFMIRHLPKNLRFTVVTNSIIIAEELRKHEMITTIVIGGVMNSKGSIKDHFAVEMVKHLRIDKSFITAGGYSAEFGMSIYNNTSVSLIKEIVKSSRQVIGLFPHEKVGVDHMVKIEEPEALCILITDWDTCKNEINKISKKGVKVMIVDEEK